MRERLAGGSWKGESEGSWFTMSAGPKFLRLDVRPILARGEEPCGEIFRRVEGLEPGEGLVVVAPFLPSPLIERLGSEGFRSRVERGKGSEWVVYFWRETE